MAFNFLLTSTSRWPGLQVYIVPEIRRTTRPSWSGQRITLKLQYTQAVATHKVIGVLGSDLLGVLPVQPESKSPSTPSSPMIQKIVQGSHADYY